jgi:hypothetical protein
MSISSPRQASPTVQARLRWRFSRFHSLAPHPSGRGSAANGAIGDNCSVAAPMASPVSCCAGWSNGAQWAADGWRRYCLPSRSSRGGTRLARHLREHRLLCCRSELASRQGGQFAHFNPRLPAAGRPQIVRDRTETKAQSWQSRGWRLIKQQGNEDYADSDVYRSDSRFGHTIRIGIIRSRHGIPTVTVVAPGCPS